jgi:hypothetical protein
METMNIKTGTMVLTDSRLQKGWTFEALRASDWSGAAFILPGRDFIPDQAVNVDVTGRIVRYDVPRLTGTPVVRVRVTFPPDGEGFPVVVSGWALASTLAD